FRFLVHGPGPVKRREPIVGSDVTRVGDSGKPRTERAPTRTWHRHERAEAIGRKNLGPSPGPSPISPSSAQRQAHRDPRKRPIARHLARRKGREIPVDEGESLRILRLPLGKTACSGSYSASRARRVMSIQPCWITLAHTAPTTG